MIYQMGFKPRFQQPPYSTNFQFNQQQFDGLGQWWANYGPRARCGPLRGSIWPTAYFKI